MGSQVGSLLHWGKGISPRGIQRKHASILAFSRPSPKLSFLSLPAPASQREGLKNCPENLKHCHSSKLTDKSHDSTELDEGDVGVGAVIRDVCECSKGECTQEQMISFIVVSPLYITTCLLP